ncbi:MAG TPA: 23S rRNA (pseudouridine(1915)-N(3))-methyltransferase RlmH [Coriobacteriia bacterium]|nr:23S rRNA (pseudouridine(1915)-N(3))-methyltransferase RlmH [Coriobacteriia bacterium]
MRLDILAVGKLKEEYWVKACDEYLKRLGRYAQIQVVEVPDGSAKSAYDIDSVLSEEATAIRRKLTPNTYLIALDQAGKQPTSEGLARELSNLQTRGHSHLSFIIGGSWGLEQALKKQADTTLSLGAITLPHNMARVVLLEQLYRSFRIINGEPYHK